MTAHSPQIVIVAPGSGLVHRADPSSVTTVCGRVYSGWRVAESRALPRRGWCSVCAPPARGRRR